MANVHVSSSDFGECLSRVDELLLSETEEEAVRRTTELLQIPFDDPTVRVWVRDDDDWAIVGNAQHSDRSTVASRRLPPTGPLTESTLDTRSDEQSTTELLVPVGDQTAVEVVTRVPDGFADRAVALVEAVGPHLERVLTDRSAADNPRETDETAAGDDTDETAAGDDTGETEADDGRTPDARRDVDTGALRRLHEATVDDASFAETVDRLLSLGCEYVGLETGLLAHVDGTDYEVAAAVDPTDSHGVGTVYELDRTVCATTVENHSTVTAFPGLANSDHRSHLASDTVRSYLGVPVTVDGETYGTVNFSAPTPHRAFEPDEREYVELIAEWVGREIERHRRIEELERYETIIEAVGDPVYALDRDGRFSFVNEAALREFGYGPEVVGDSPSIGMDEADVARIREQIERLLASDDRSTTAEFELRTADGDPKVVENRIAVIGDDEFRGTAGVIRDVTERTERRQQLESFQRAVEEASDGVAILDGDEYTYADETHAEMYGLDDRSELLGETWRQLYDDEEARRIDTEAFSTLDTDGEWQGMVTGSRPDGSTFPAELSLTRLDDDRLVCTVRDETDRLEREQRRRATVDVLERMYEVTTDQSLSRSEKIDALLEAGTDYLELPYGFLTEIETDVTNGGTQTITHAHGDHGGLQPGASCPLPESYCRRTVERDELMTVLDATAEGWGDDPAYERFALGSYVGGPIHVDDDTHGTVCFAGPSARDRPFSPTERSFVGLLRRWISYEISREAARAELSEEREQLRLLIDSLDEYAFVVLDGDGRVQRWNTGAESLFGYESTDATGMAVEELLPEDRQSVAERLLQQARVAGESSDEGWYTRRGGSQFYGDVQYATLEDDGEFRGYAVVVRDLTDRRRQRRRTEQFVEKSEDVVTIADTEGRITYASGSAERVLGCDPERLVDQNLFDYVHEDERETAIESFYTAVDGAESEVEVECRFRTPDGEWRNLQIHCRNMLDSDAIDGMLLYLRDVTEMREQMRRFESIFNQTFQFTGLLQPDGTVIEANESALKFGGIEREEIVGREFPDVLWWNHSETVYDRIQAAIVQARNGEFVRYETEVRGADGLATIDFSLKPVRNDSGEVVLLVAEGRDVTLQRQRRQHLEVVQRVLRHNMRNDLSKVRGWSELMAEEPDPETRSEQFERIDGIIDRWRSMTERVKEIRQMLQTEPEDQRTARLEKLVARAVGTVRERHSSVTVDTDLHSEQLEVPTSVEKAVGELLQNAASVTDDATLEVTATRPEEGWVEIDVYDDGPGMPDSEAEVLETGEETSLIHGQGLGLWMVRMIVTQAGGDISVDPGDDGTRVSPSADGLPRNSRRAWLLRLRHAGSLSRRTVTRVRTRTASCDLRPRSGTGPSVESRASRWCPSCLPFPARRAGHSRGWTRTDTPPSSASVGPPATVSSSTGVSR